MRIISRLARMDRAELMWRGAAATRIAIDRARARISPPRWDRRELRAALAPLPELAAARAALEAGRWDDAQRELAVHFSTAPRRFPVQRAQKVAVADWIRREFPDRPHHAAARADRILAGEYDLLGYRALRFDRSASSTHLCPSCPSCWPSAAIDWHYDPVHDRHAPQLYWSDVPYLDPASGDHKIIWELNRHQHWLTLGRAYWLTGNATYRTRFIAELTSWMQSNPPLTGINWASMLELGFRSISGIWALEFFVETPGPAEAGHHRREELDRAPWIVDLLLGLDRQLTHVERNLSYYFSPNTHLLGEALALYVAGRAVPELAASARRAATGRRVLVAEIDRQIASDGGHCERSTHYHRYTLDFYLLALAVARVTGDPAAAHFEQAADRLATAARLLADDNGRLPLIGDDDGGALMPMTGRDPEDARGTLAIAAVMLNRPELQIGHTPEDVCWMLGEPRALHIPDSTFHIASSALPETGYYVSRSPRGDHLVIDGGPHGYQNAGHAHADALSLTFGTRGVPLLIDPGTASYTTDSELRDRMRSSAMHNTLTIDGRSQSVPDGPFHWTHTADGRVNRWAADRSFDYFDGAHDGYAPIEHRRRVFVRHGDLLVVADFVDAIGRHRAAVHWHIDPRWTVDLSGRRVTLTLNAKAAKATTGDDSAGSALSVVSFVPQGLVETFTGDEATGLGWCSPAYGRVEKATTVRVSREGDGPFWMASVFGLDPANPIADVEWMPVWAEAGTLMHGAALRITRANSTDYVLFAEPSSVARPFQGRDRGPERPALQPQTPPTWRMGEIETDARMLCCRIGRDRRATCLAMVDGSFAGLAGSALQVPHSEFQIEDPPSCVGLQGS